MTNDVHGRFDDVVAANFCGFSFFYSHVVFVLKTMSTMKAFQTGQHLLQPEEEWQQREWLLPTG
jgi:hypothetical protein